MIYITGDTHGLIDFAKLNFFNTIYTSKKDILIILGDAGIVWSEDELQKIILQYELLGMTVIFVDGNHENFNLLNNYPIIKMYDARMHKISNSIYHVLRGEIMVINNLKFFCIGGAISIDKRYRILNKSYWLQEEITEENINDALKNLEKHNFEVDYVLTHCIDTLTLIKEFGYNSDSCTDKLNFIDKFVKYKNWYFGHYHVDRTFNKKRCFYNDILTINNLYLGNKSKKIIRNIYLEQKIKNLKYFTNTPYLYSNFDYKTKIIKEDLPEWFVYGRYHKRFGYLSSKNIIKIRYRPNMWINHYLRDDSLIINYSDSLEIRVYGHEIIDMIKAIEKYNNVNLNYLKLKINYKAIFYNRYHQENNYFSQVEKAFNYVEDEDLFEVIDTLIKMVVEVKKISLPVAAEIVMHSDLSDLIFDKDTNYYDQPIKKLFEILKDETGLKRKYSWE